MTPMGRAGRIWCAVAAAAILAASLAGILEPAVAAAPAAGAERTLTGGEGTGAVAAAKAKKHRKGDKKGDKKADRRGAAKRDGQRRGKKNRPKPTQPDTVSTCLSVGVPAYFDDADLWSRMTASAPTTDMIVLNPESGPDVRRSDTWAAYTRAAQAAGITVVGYVQTDLGERDPALVKDEIDKYFAWYAVDGIFLDETSNYAETLPYYRQLSEYVRAAQPRAKVVVNPGWWPEEEMMDFVDVVVTFEWTYDEYIKQQFPNWTLKYDPKRFMHIVYGVPGDAAAREVLNLARERNAGRVYLTDVSDVNRVFKSLGGGLWDFQLTNACP
jgi:hypothetical protein